mgnify:CR=1 FL=1
MTKKKTEPLGRVTMTLPRKLLDEVENRIETGMYASVSEWIRHAIREQLNREERTLHAILRDNPRAENSLRQALAGEGRELDLDSAEI